MGSGGGGTVWWWYGVVGWLNIGGWGDGVVEVDLECFCEDVIGQYNCMLQDAD